MPPHHGIGIATTKIYLAWLIFDNNSENVILEDRDFLIVVNCCISWFLALAQKFDTDLHAEPSRVYEILAATDVWKQVTVEMSFVLVLY